MSKIRRPVVIILLPYILGIVFTKLFSHSVNLFLYNLILSAMLFLGFLSLKFKRLIKVFLVFVSLMTGSFFYFLSNELVPKNHLVNVVIPEEEVIITGDVVSVPENSQDKTSFVINAKILEKEGKFHHVSGKVRINIYKGGGDIDYGDRIRISAKITIPRSFKNPGGFDYNKFLKDRGILLIGNVKSDLFVINKFGYSGNAFFGWINDWRKILIEDINTNFSTHNSSMLIATLFGERSGLSEEIENKFKYSGTYHIFAISGFNIGLVSFIFYIFFRAVGLKPATASVPSIVAVILYSVLAGMQPSVERAMIMAITYFISVILKRESDIYNSLFVAAFIILIIDPNAINDVGFILTFSATLSIIYLTPRFNTALNFISFNYLRGLISASLSAQIGVTPILAFYFNNISLTAALANLFVVPLASLIFGLGLVFLVCTVVFKSGLLYIDRVLNLMLTSMLSTVDIFSKLPFSYIKAITPNILQIISFYLIVFLIARYSRRRSLQLVLLLIGIILSLSFLSGFPDLSGSGELKVTFLDVGEGDSALIEFPDGKTALVDGGGTHDDKFDIGEKVVSPYLLFKRIRILDYVFLTHPHPDHMNGLKAVLRNFSVKNFWEGCATASYSPGYRLIKEEILKSNITYKQVLSGKKYEICKNVSVRLLHPSEKFCDKKNSPSQNMNNQSLVFQLKYKKVSILFTGDIEREAMEDIIGRDENIKSTVIKIPHHGSKDSACFEFYKKVLPMIAVISVGLNNPFHHPSNEVLEICKKIGAKIYRTDKNGAVILKTDGIRVWIKTMT